MLTRNIESGRIYIRTCMLTEHNTTAVKSEELTEYVQMS